MIFTKKIVSNYGKGKVYMRDARYSIGYVGA